MKFIREFNENIEFPEYQNDLDHLRDYIDDLEDNSIRVSYKSACFSDDCTFIRDQEVYGNFYNGSDSWDKIKKRDGREIFPGFIIDVFNKISMKDSLIEEIYNESKIIMQFESRLKSRFPSGTFINKINLDLYTFHIHTSTIDGFWKIWDPSSPGGRKIISYT